MLTQVLIVIGLPGAGKTTYLDSLPADYLRFDDFLATWYRGEIVAALQQGQKVALADPRLCYLPTFQRIVERLQHYSTDISLILFPNDPELAKSRSAQRGAARDSRLAAEIDRFSEHYCLENYQGYPSKLLKI